MRKVLFLASAVLAITFASCGNKAKTAEEAVDSTAVVTAADSITEVLSEKLSASDPAEVQTTLESLKAKYEELVKAGKLEQAAEYASKVQAFINEHAEEISKVASGNTTISSIVDGIKNLPTNVESAAKDAASAVKSDAEQIASDAVDKAKEEASKKVDETVNNAKEEANKKVNEKVEEANKKANDAVNKAFDKLKK